MRAHTKLVSVLAPILTCQLLCPKNNLNYSTAIQSSITLSTGNGNSGVLVVHSYCGSSSHSGRDYNDRFVLVLDYKRRLYSRREGYDLSYHTS